MNFLGYSQGNVETNREKNGGHLNNDFDTSRYLTIAQKPEEKIEICSNGVVNFNEAAGKKFLEDAVIHERNTGAAASRQNKIGTASKMLAAHLPPLGQCARAGMDRVLAKQPRL